MKLKYKHQKFQEEAARAVVEAFAGQPYQDPTLEVRREEEDGRLFDEVIYGNAPLSVDRTLIRDNVRRVQREQGLRPIDKLEGEELLGSQQDGDPAPPVTLTVEMETGTGKTYTYIKTILELHRAYGWSKFVIVVPSVAIREGVYKSLQTMEEHFLEEYEERIHYFIYDSKQLTKIDRFAGDPGLQVMIINMQAFNSSFNEEKSNKTARIIFSHRDEFQSRRPIDLLAATRPVMIIDEPQSVLGADAKSATRRGLRLFRPVAMLLYSATPREVINPVYRLDAMDAYNRKLVKKIEVKGIRAVGGSPSDGYLYLEEILIGRDRAPRARVTFDHMTQIGKRGQVTRTLSVGDNLYELSGGLDEYRKGYRLEDIDGRSGRVTWSGGLELTEGDAVGASVDALIRRTQIRETIRTHLEREQELFGRGIKVLSLFFIDHVASYRIYGEEGPEKGPLAEIFEEEYRKEVDDLIKELPKGSDYRKYLERFAAEQVHNGYFSMDKKGHAVDSKEKRGEVGSDDEGAYELIMKDKERLLSFDEPTRFIFSHSALREGWDNPNVFQICTLKESNAPISKRQEVGRGMRLAVDSHGERQDADRLGSAGVFDVNVLTVIAGESYEDFAKALQHEIADAIGDRPKMVTEALFVGQPITDDEGRKIRVVTEEEARMINYQLITRKYVDSKGHLTEDYEKAKADDTIDLGEELSPLKRTILRILGSLFDPKQIRIDNARNRREAHFREDKFQEQQFQALWQQINAKSCYIVDFDTDELVRRAVEALDKDLSVTPLRLVVTTGRLDRITSKDQLQQGGAMTCEQSATYGKIESATSSVRYDLIGDLVRATGLTRRTIAAILTKVKAETFGKFQTNPDEFIRKAGLIIDSVKAIAVVEKITYCKTDQTYDADIFTESALRGEMGETAMESEKSLYDLVVVDSKGVEYNFADKLERSTEVAVYTKLPRGFYIRTPMGRYNPDWAIVFNERVVNHIYFIAETKGNSWDRAQLRPAEQAKIECAAKHFAAIRGDNPGVIYDVVSTYDELLNKVMN